MKFSLSVLTFILSTSLLTAGSKMTWPSLTQFSATTGRAATAKDVDNGSAVFVLSNSGKPIGTPINIVLPQYALHVDSETGVKTPCIVIQAEQANGQKLIGAYLLPEMELFAGLYSEFVLLGTNIPTTKYK